MKSDSQTILHPSFNKIRGKNWRKRHNLWSCGWLLHQDNVPVLFVCHFLAEKLKPVFKLAPYSLELSLDGFFLLAELKNFLKGTHFQST
jgi:hypothetical protein